MPLAQITLRRYEKPYDLSKRELIRKICLSLGFLQPGDSRDIIVDIILVLEDARKQKQWLDSYEIRNQVESLRKSNSQDKKGLAESNIRRQLKRLRDALLLDKQENKYRISEFSPISELFENKIVKFIIPQTVERIREYLSRID